MLNLSKLGKIREKQNAFVYLHLLSTFLEGISEQRTRIKSILSEFELLQLKIADPEEMDNAKEEFWASQKSLFREIRVFFWWWHSAYIIIWTGENIRNSKDTTGSLVEILGTDFASDIKKYKDRVELFSKVRNDLEHILERIHNDERNLGNLRSINANEHYFTFGDREIDISLSTLDLVDALEAEIDQWMGTQA